MDKDFFMSSAKDNPTQNPKQEAEYIETKKNVVVLNFHLFSIVSLVVRVF